MLKKQEELIDQKIVSYLSEAFYLKAISLIYNTQVTSYPGEGSVANMLCTVD